MDTLWTNMQTLQDINTKEKGITFTEEGFTDLYNDVMEVNWEWNNDVILATGKGILIGAVSVGLIGLGVKGLKKLRKRKPDDEHKEDTSNLDRVRMFEPEVMEINDDGNVVVRVSKKDREALQEIIKDINENEKKH